MSEIVFLTAYEIASGIKSKIFSAVEVLEAHLAHISKYNPALNAIITLNENAMAHAKSADEALSNGMVWGPLHGVPVSFKDLFETKGILTTWGHELGKENIPKVNAPIVERLLSAGAIVLGKTNMPKNGADFQTYNLVFGRTNNPWNVKYTSGGSSGGGAAAIAGGLSPLEFGNDLGGSLRIPAHFCGVYSLKPTESRVPTSLRYNTRFLRSMVATGPIARCIDDLKLGLQIIEGPDGREWDIPPTIHEKSTKLPLSEYRIAWCEGFKDLPLAEDSRLALQGLVSTLSEAGCHITRSLPENFDFEAAWGTFGELFGCQTSYIENPMLRLMGRGIEKVLPSRFIPGGSIESGFVRGVTFSYHQYLSALTRRDFLIGKMEKFLSKWDAWLCPVAASHAFTHRPTKSLLRKPLEVDDQKLSYLTWGVGYASILSLTGNPVVTFPAGLSRDGLPIGFQLVGRRWQDKQLMEIAKSITEITGGYERPPLMLS